MGPEFHIRGDCLRKTPHAKSPVPFFVRTLQQIVSARIFALEGISVLLMPTDLSSIRLIIRVYREKSKGWGTLLDIYSSELIGEVRRNVVRDLLQAQEEEDVIKSIICLEFDEGQVLQKKKMWMEMQGDG